MNAAIASPRPIGLPVSRRPATATRGDGRTLSRAERSIVRRLAARDPRGLEELYALTSRPCFALLLDLLGDRGHAEDVQQQVFAELWRRSGEFDAARGTLLSWVLVVARSRGIDHLRKRRDQPLDGELLEVVASRQPGVDGRASDYANVLDRWVVADALDRLPAQERELLRLRFWEGLSQSEIAARERLPLGTVKSRMLSALSRLRDDLPDARSQA